MGILESGSELAECVKVLFRVSEEWCQNSVLTDLIIHTQLIIPVLWIEHCGHLAVRYRYLELKTKGRVRIQALIYYLRMLLKSRTNISLDSKHTTRQCSFHCTSKIYPYSLGTQNTTFPVAAFLIPCRDESHRKVLLRLHWYGYSSINGRGDGSEILKPHPWYSESE